MPKIFLYLAWFSLLLSNCVTAVKLYKLEDADGNITYQDYPPTTGQKFEEKSFTNLGAKTSKNKAVRRQLAVREKPVFLFLAPNCDSCDLLRAILEANKVPFESLNVENDANNQKKLIQLVNEVRVPTLQIGEQVISGLNRNQIEDALRENGYPIGIEAIN